MNRIHGKSKTNVFILSILFLILVFLIVNTTKTPLLAWGSVTCGEGGCSCSCTGLYCDCSAGPGEQCYCTCSFPFDYDYCNSEKEGPDLPG